jgi:peptidyl-prolyl cis-trans isomerase SurA
MLRSRVLVGVALAALVSQSALAQTAPTLDVTPRAAPAEALAPAPQEAAPAPQGESIAAVVNDELISTYDLRQRLLLVLLQAGVQPTEAQFRQFQREALQRLIDERLQMQELRRQETERKLVGKLIASEAQVNAAMNRLAQQSNLTLPQFEAALAGAGVNIQTLRERTRAELSWDRWINGRFGQYIRIGPEQVAATIQQINESSTRPSYRINEIFIDAARVGGQAEALAGAQQLVDQILAGAAFSAVARGAPAGAADRPADDGGTGVSAATGDGRGLHRPAAREAGRRRGHRSEPQAGGGAAGRRCA